MPKCDKLFCSFIQNAFQHGCSPEHLFLRRPLDGCFIAVQFFFLGLEN